MTALPCPACGYLTSCHGLVDLMTMIATEVWYECDRCEGRFVLEPHLSPDGVGPERLVPVEVGA